MTNKTKPIPDGYHSLTPYLVAVNAASAIEFYKKAFGATERMRLAGPDGKIMHAELEIGDSVIMLGGESAGGSGPASTGGALVSMYFYTEDVDAVFSRAIALGATVKKPVEDQFYGDRSGILTDPFGHVWSVATHVEDVSPEEIKKRTAALFGG